MAGTAKNYDSTTITVGFADLWAGLAVPAGAARLTLDADGTPDATANPDAIHLGHTAEGNTLTINFTKTDYYVDETPFPIKTSIDQSTVELTGNLVQVFDEEVLQVIGAGFATYSTAAGYKQLTLGTKAALPYQSVALIGTTPMDDTKQFIIQLYDAINTAGLSVQFGAKVRGQTPFTFSARAITSRTATDALGNYWWEI
jgi:hypothetical protein